MKKVSIATLVLLVVLALGAGAVAGYFFTKKSVPTTPDADAANVIAELAIAKLKEMDNNNTEKLLDYRIDSVKILSDSEKQNWIQMGGYEENDILAEVTYSVKPENVNASNWTAGNGEINGEWITNKVACVCLRDGKLSDFATGW